MRSGIPSTTTTTTTLTLITSDGANSSNQILLTGRSNLLRKCHGIDINFILNQYSFRTMNTPRSQKALLLAIPTLLLFKFYTSGHYTRLVPRNYDKQKNKNILIIGGNEGIGVETAKYLYNQQANVIIASRNAQKGQRVVQMLQSK